MNFNYERCIGPTWKNLQRGSCWPCSLSLQPPESAGRQTAAGSCGSSVIKNKKNPKQTKMFHITHPRYWGVQRVNTELQGEVSFISERRRRLVFVLWTNTARCCVYVTDGWGVKRHIRRSMARDVENSNSVSTGHWSWKSKTPKEGSWRKKMKVFESRLTLYSSCNHSFWISAT